MFLNKSLDLTEKKTVVSALRLEDQSKLMNIISYTNEKDIQNFLKKKLLSSGQPKEHGSIWYKKFYNYDFQSVPQSDQSVIVEKTLEINNETYLELSFSLIMNGNTMKRSSLMIKSFGFIEREIFRLDSVIGGLSSYLGDEDDNDDTEANASVNIYLLGLPLRKLVLFSSLGELMDHYWSGRLEKRTSYLTGTMALFNEKEDVLLANGLKLEIHLLATLSLDLSASAEISLWTQSGQVQFNNAGAVTFMSRININNVIVSETSVTAQVHFTSNIHFRATKPEPLICVILNQDATKIKILEKTTVSGNTFDNSKEIVIAGRTWNLDRRNNIFCNMF